MSNSERSNNNNRKIFLEHVGQIDKIIKEHEQLKEKCSKLETQNLKLHIELKAKNNTISKLQESIAEYVQKSNNTSNTFLLPSEFKTAWESLVHDKLVEAFDSVFQNYELLSHLAQESILAVYKSAKELLQSKILSLTRTLNINIESVSEINTFLKKFRFLFQEYYSDIFNIDEVFLENVKGLIVEEMQKLDSSIFKDNTLDDIISDLNTRYFILFIELSFKICIFMLLHDPVLSFDIKPVEERKFKYFFFCKKNFINIEGFHKENQPCVIILSPPLFTNKFQYQNLKSAVYMIPEPNDEIMSICLSVSGNKPISSSRLNNSHMSNLDDLSEMQKEKEAISQKIKAKKAKKQNSISIKNNISNSSGKSNFKKSNKQCILITGNTPQLNDMNKKLFTSRCSPRLKSPEELILSLGNELIQEKIKNKLLCEKDANELADCKESTSNLNGNLAKKATINKDGIFNANPESSSNSNNSMIINSSAQQNRSKYIHPSRNSSVFESYSNSLNKESTKTMNDLLTKNSKIFNVDKIIHEDKQENNEECTLQFYTSKKMFVKTQSVMKNGNCDKTSTFLAQNLQNLNLQKSNYIKKLFNKSKNIEKQLKPNDMPKLTKEKSISILKFSRNSRNKEVTKINSNKDHSDQISDAFRSNIDRRKSNEASNSSQIKKSPTHNIDSSKNTSKNKQSIFEKSSNVSQGLICFPNKQNSIETKHSTIFNDMKFNGPVNYDQLVKQDIESHHKIVKNKLDRYYSKVVNSSPKTSQMSHFINYNNDKTIQACIEKQILKSKNNINNTLNLKLKSSLTMVNTSSTGITLLLT